MAVDYKFVALGFASENGMIVQHEHFAVVSRLPQEEQRRRQAADSTADNYTIKNLTGVDNIFRKVVKLAIDELDGVLA